MSPENSLSDMRKKLLEIQNELLKGTGEKPSPTNNNSQNSADNITAYSIAPVNRPADHHGDETVQLLKELLSSQHKIIAILGEINNKLK